MLIFFREVDFVNESVRTLAGNGKKGSDYRGGGAGNSQVRTADKFNSLVSCSIIPHVML